MKILVAHPGKQHSYRLSSALQKTGLLHSFATEVYAKKSSWMMNLIKRFVGPKNRKRANAHYNPDLDDSKVVQFCEVEGFLLLLALRLDKSMKLYRWLSPKFSDRFGIKIAKYAIKNEVDMVIGYDTNCVACFKYLKAKAPHIKRVMDVSIAARPYMKTLYEDFAHNSTNTFVKDENMCLWNDGVGRFQTEISDTDCFLVASDFVRDSLLYCGVDSSRIYKVPYGANVSSNEEIKAAKQDDVLNVLFVGQVNARKGIPLLLDCFSTLDSDKYKLTITGSYNRKSPYIAQHLDDKNVEFTGFVTADKMRQIYEESNVFVLPSVAEGMAQVGVEAMACGLPVVCTYNSGLSDLIIEGETGFLIPVGDENALREKLEWFASHMDLIKPMGEKAREVAQRYTWSIYEKNVVHAIEDIMRSEKS